MKLIMECPVVEYDSSKGVTIDELVTTFEKFKDYKPRKPEYILSKWEAENLPMWQLNWLGENNIVLCSLEVANIITERERNVG